MHEVVPRVVAIAVRIGNRKVQYLLPKFFLVHS